MTQPQTDAIKPPNRRDPAVATIARSWRALTTPSNRTRAGNGARTVIACSAGADSSALVLALAAAQGRASKAASRLIVAHIVHDARPEPEALADRDAARRLAAALDLPFAEARIFARAARGNLEAAMRRERYLALARIAVEHDAAFVATAHHAHDQLETLMMALLRGSGPAGLRGIARRRPLAQPHPPAPSPLWLIRPALQVDPADLRRLCTQSDWSWREDPTNADTSRLRSNLRRNALPPLLALRPDAALRAHWLTVMFGSIDDMLRARAEQVWAKRLAEPDPDAARVRWALADLRSEPAPVIAYALQLGAKSLTRAARIDRLSAAHLWNVVERVRRASNASGSFSWPGVRIAIAKGEITLTSAPRPA